MCARFFSVKALHYSVLYVCVWYLHVSSNMYQLLGWNDRIFYSIAKTGRPNLLHISLEQFYAREVLRWTYIIYDLNSTALPYVFFFRNIAILQRLATCLSSISTHVHKWCACERLAYRLTKTGYFTSEFGCITSSLPYSSNICPPNQALLSYHGWNFQLVAVLKYRNILQTSTLLCEKVP